jgi:predicted RNA binding protein YcfA (HicA-like mRNA interferase family)
MKHEDGRRAVVPVHPGKDIPKGTLKGILRDIEVTVNQLITFLNN